MKKEYFILGFLLLLLNACSSDSAGSSDLLVKEIHSKVISYDGFDTEYEQNSKFTYDGNKLLSITYYNTSVSNISSANTYTYTGDLITTMKIGSGFGQYYAESHYQYDSSDRLIKETTQPISSNIPLDLKVYTYNPDGTILRECYHSLTANPTDLYESDRIYLDSSNRLAKMEILLNGTIWTTKNEATYSNKYSPFKNVVGYDKLFMLTDTKFGFATYKEYTNHSTYDYVMNNSNFPKSRKNKVITAAGATASETTDNYKYY